MAIQVICPGCMSRFEVSDRFAGKKGPCPKCGAVIEIPKEKLVIHAPEDITSGEKVIKGGTTLRPILQQRFIFTRQQLVGALFALAGVLLISFLLGWLPGGLLKTVLAFSGLFLVGIPLVSYGYMMVRDEDDLEILLGNELYRRATVTAVGFWAIWFFLEWIVNYLNPGPLVVLYLLPTVLLGGFVGMIIFDINFGKAVLFYLLFAISIIILRGLMFAPSGWIWQQLPETGQGIGVQMKTEVVPELGKPSRTPPANPLKRR